MMYVQLTFDSHSICIRFLFDSHFIPVQFELKTFEQAWDKNKAAL